MNKIFLFLSFFYLLSGNLTAQEQVIDEVIAIIGNDIILKSDIEAQYLQVMAQGVDFDGDLRCKLLEDMMFQKILLNQAQLDSIDVSEKEVEQRVDYRLTDLIAQAGDEQTLIEYFGKEMSQIKYDLKKLLYEQMMTQKMQGKVTDDIKITPGEVRSFFKDIPEGDLPLINAELEFAHLSIKPEISEAAIQEVKDKLQDFIQRINNGTKFNTLAILYSEDPGSARKGGELGFKTRKDFIPEFSAVAFRLNEPGEVSSIVETSYGYHIIQLIEKRGERSNFRHILLTPKIPFTENERVINLLDSIANEIRSGKLSFEEAAKKYSSDDESRNTGGIMINPRTGLSKFLTDEIDAALYKQIKNLKTGEISSPFESRTADNKVIYEIVRLNSKTEPHLANIKQDYSYLQELALSDKKNKAMQEWLEKKQKSIYIKIKDEYRNCDFESNGWIK
jgi:peptidyl-prolyl cis-trans isomerase SurA